MASTIHEIYSVGVFCTIHVDIRASETHAIHALYTVFVSLTIHVAGAGRVPSTIHA